MPDENLAAIREAVERGIHIAIVTGRSFFLRMPAVAPLPDPLTLVVYNGAMPARERRDAHAPAAAGRAARCDVLDGDPRMA